MQLEETVESIISSQKYINLKSESGQGEKAPTYYDVVKSKVDSGELKEMPFLVSVNGRIRELRHTYHDNDVLEYLYYDNSMVKEAYAKTAIFMLLDASFNATERKYDAALRFRIKNGYYFEYDDTKCTEELVEKIKSEFEKLIAGKYVIEKKNYSREAAMDYFKEYKMWDIELLYKYYYKAVINVRSLPGYIKYSAGKMLYDTSFIKTYEIRKYKDGFVLIIPSTDDITKLETFRPGDIYFAVQKDAIDWTNKMLVNTAGRINAVIAQNRMDDLIIMTESYQDKKIGDIANKIKESRKKIVLVAGPSSSGKTSFSHRLMYHLRALELNPYPIATDNFFVERDQTPKDENGEYDFECLGAMDIKLLNDTLNSLIDGKETVMPTFDFTFGRKTFNTKLKLKDEDILILEGIHCLNPELLPGIGESNAYKIFISALAQISIDRFNRISTSDLRLIRRMERDRKTRGYSIKDTILRWDSVRKGEEKYIFPYQDYADDFFNSAICYELNILKTNVTPLLYEYVEDKEVGSTVKRLLNLLNFFLGVYTEAIPRHSILREFLGGSILDVS